MIIAARFNGPPGSGNGGYSSGVFAGALGSAVASVTLRQPPPLDVPLTVRPAGAGIAIYDGESLVAEVSPAAGSENGVVPQVSVAAARAASASYPGFVDHPFPTCYVCGPLRADGLRVFPGLLGDGRTAAVWTVPPEVATETVWAALDCPGGWAIVSPGRPYILGRMTARVRSVPNPGTECVVVGELLGTEGRKAHVRTSLYGTDQAPLAVASAVWLAI
jgi:hypothetical protein